MKIVKSWKLVRCGDVQSRNGWKYRKEDVMTSCNAEKKGKQLISEIALGFNCFDDQVKGKVCLFHVASIFEFVASSVNSVIYCEPDPIICFYNTAPRSSVHLWLHSTDPSQLWGVNPWSRVLVSVFMESAAFLTGFKFSEVFRLIVRRDQRLWDGLWKWRSGIWGWGIKVNIICLLPAQTTHATSFQ